MSDICCGVPVPPVPERPIDLNQPAYVLVDGRWVLLSEIIGEYLPPAPTAGVVRQIKHIDFAPSEFVPFVGATGAQVLPTIVFEPSSPTSHVSLVSSLSITLSGTPGGLMPMTAAFRHQINTDNYVPDEPWPLWGASSLLSKSGSMRQFFAPQRDLSPAQRRTDDGKWGVGLWVNLTAVGVTVENVVNTQVTITEYEPTA